MIAGLSLDAWILMAAAVGIGLAIELRYLAVRRRSRSAERGAGRMPGAGEVGE